VLKSHLAWSPVISVINSRFDSSDVQNSLHVVVGLALGLAFGVQFPSIYLDEEIYY
jgi:hypothetical protein